MKEIIPKFDLFNRNDLRAMNTLNVKSEGTLIYSKTREDNIKARLDPQKSKYVLSYTVDINRDNKFLLQFGTVRKQLRYVLDKREFLLENVAINSVSFTIPEQVEASVYAIRDKRFKNNSKKYHKAYIPVSESFSFHNKLQEHIYATDLGFKSRESIQITLSDEVIQVYLINDRTIKPVRKYAVITSGRKQLFEEFFSKVTAVQIVLGYLTAYLPGDRGCFFQYSSKNMKDAAAIKIMGIRETVESNYRPLDSNPYVFIRHKKKDAKKLYKELQVIPDDVLSRLVRLTLEKPKVAGVLLLVIEASTSSLLQMPGSLAIALETMTKLINEDKTIIWKSTSSLVPMPSVRKKLLKGWRDILNDNKEQLGKAYDVIHKRLDTLLVATNQDKLNAPFLKLKIALNDADLDLLDKRNDFLHGKFPAVNREKPFVGNEIRRIDLDLLYCGAKYYTLVNLLILKWIGFEGQIINYPKVYENLTGISLNEEPYRKV